MATVGIICEYNPFHNGHKYQIDEIKKLFGEETVIVCVMSGSYTQRGDVSVLNKYERARIAVECGASLVLELPFPYSASSAEFFAEAGVEILERLGCVDYLCFGSECGDVEIIKRYAQIMLSEDFKNAFIAEKEKKENKKLGYAQILEKTAKILFTNEKDFDIIKGANNILGIEYVKALIRRSSKIQPITVRREGESHTDTSTLSSMASASAIRQAIYGGRLDLIESAMPPETLSTVQNAEKIGEIHSIDELSDVILAHFRLNADNSFTPAECADGVYKRLFSSAEASQSLAEMLDALTTKKYTNAKFRRAILFSLLKVSDDDMRAMPEYTALLAADKRGTELLSKIRKKKRINILTTPADYTALPENARAQATLNNRADSIYSLSCRKKGTGYDLLCMSPYIKK